jgi:hypothetical protein
VSLDTLQRKAKLPQEILSFLAEANRSALFLWRVEVATVKQIKAGHFSLKIAGDTDSDRNN